MQTAQILFWFFSFVIFYSYLGYGILLWSLLKIRRKKQENEMTMSITNDFFPEVTLVIPAYNEEDFIREKIANTLLLEYPYGKLTTIFITDGSTDKTPTVIAEYPQFVLMHNNERNGKVAAMNRAMLTVKTAFVIFCDANTLLNKTSVKEIVKHYKDEKVGGVAGEKRVLELNEEMGAEKGEGFYWKYESYLKSLDSEFYSVVGAAGELFSFRTSLFQELEEDTLLDDFMISLRICQKGYRIIYESRAYAIEKPSSDIKEEQKRKIRISAGSFQSMGRLLDLLNIFKYPKLSFQYISHRVLRWAVCPFALPLIFILNLVLLEQGSFVYKFIFAAQSIFYFMAFLGWVMMKVKKSSGILNFPFYFLFMNISLYIGFVRYLKGNQTVKWEKAKRKV